MFYLDPEKWLKKEPEKYTKEDYERDMSEVRERMRKGREYYWDWPLSKKKDYRRWQKYFKSKINA